MTELRDSSRHQTSIEAAVFAEGFVVSGCVGLQIESCAQTSKKKGARGQTTREGRAGMGLPPRVFYTLHEAAVRWECTLSDIAGWASAGRFNIVTGIGPVGCGDRNLAGLVAVPVSDILPMFSQSGAGPACHRIRRIRAINEPEWATVSDPVNGIEITVADLVIMADEARRFEEECDLLQRPAVHIGSTAKYDWDGMYLALIRRVHDQGVPLTQAEWVGEVQEWFVARSKTGEVPDESTIRRRLNPIWKALRDP